ncbi:WUSCHEL-related homeobox 9-like [Hibiscus syriacus]|uniref:WUSCHEL-related homeobox 9-like n=1 Tax=Hibiscus syriacus TaxID=106335 RepID=A0A6A3A8R8_HIBSY|nr:LOB domain-containing protein 12-like [Hibiscus syriacus]KAE8700528.1 WUSCHEL-related homeobox 9-like [Hibiscus syriacus]
MSNPEEASNYRHACAACKYQRRKCEANCLFALYFPADKANIFREVHKIFGVKNVTAILSSLSPHERERAVESLEWEAFAWKSDPVEGPLGLFKHLKRELQQLKNQQQQNGIIVPYSNYQTNHGVFALNHNAALGDFAHNPNINAANSAYGINPNIGMEQPFNSYAGLPQIRGGEIENHQVMVNNGIPMDSSYYRIQQEQGSALRKRLGADIVVQPFPTSHKQQMPHNNQMLGSFSMGPPTNSFGQHNDQQRESRRRRVFGHLPGPASQSQGRGFH